MEKRCEYCDDTGWYGDKGPGMRGNSEYMPCDMCEAHGSECVPPHWTKAPPRRNGWFWAKIACDVGPTVVEPVMCHRYYYTIRGAGFALNYDGRDVFWSEEIKPPPLPEDEL
ncbi:MAG: hypothetical protein GY832_02655 [Chloroflexi bacterium]|nr:hypothetical protein [Chloroflexota bacterium]